jgi:hypothetical protein
MVDACRVMAFESRKGTQGDTKWILVALSYYKGIVTGYPEQ